MTQHHVNQYKIYIFSTSFIYRHALMFRHSIFDIYGDSFNCLAIVSTVYCNGNKNNRWRLTRIYHKNL